jgi:hypothetical protein
MSNNNKTESTPNNIVELLPVDNEELVTVTGGRSYGWGGGGWEVGPRPDGQTGPTAGPLRPLP